MIEFYLPDGSLAGDLVFTGLEAGADSDVLSIEAWHSRAIPGGTARENVRFVLEVEDPARPDIWLASGLPPQDELWGRYRITGFDNTGDPSWSVATTDWQSLGARRHAEVARIPSDCAVKIDLVMHPPASAAPTSYRWHLVPVYSESSRAVLPGPPEPGTAGVLQHNGDRRRSYLIRGCQLTVPVAPTGDVVTVEAGLWLHQGRVRGKVSTTHQLDQVDGDGLPLVDGTSYVATLSLGANTNATKGPQAAAPDRPVVPTGEALVRYVEVGYEAGAVSLIDPADASGDPAYGRYFAELAGGLGIRLYPGQAIAGETLRYHDVPRVLLAPDESDVSLWILADGSPAFAAAPPETTSLDLWRSVTVAGNVTELEDLRQPLRTPRVFEIAGTPISAGVIAGTWWDGPAVDVESLVVRISDGGGATAGQTLIDVTVDGVSIFDFGVEDLRPAFAFDATELRVDPIHQFPAVPTGALIELVAVELPTGGAPAAASVSLITARS